MVRNFVTGVVLGGVVAAGGLAAVSLMAPLPQRPAGGVVAPAPEDLSQKAPEPVVPPEPAKPADAAVENPAVEEAPADAGVAAEPEPDEPLLKPLVENAAPPPASVVPETLPEPVPAPETVAEAAPKAETPATPSVPEGGADTPPAPETKLQQEAEKGTAMPAPDAEPSASAEAETAAAETAVEAEPAATELPAATDPAAPAPAVPDAAKPDTATPEVATPEAAGAKPAPVPSPDTSFAPSAGLASNRVEGVTTGRLPTIAPAAPAAEASLEPAAPGLADLPPVQRFARPFDNPDGKPLFAILLIDPGTPGLNRAELAALPFAVTFILDPLAEGAAEAAAIYRGAGQEVLMAATAIPPGAKASDLEQSFAGLEGRLPEAVGLIETPEPRFQDDRTLAADVVTLLADQGRGLVTYDRGLNAADQVARRENLPSATIFRSLDDDGEDSPLIRRYLDRAAFKAAQEGKVAVIGTARPETIAALLEWSVEGRSSTVALAPITALMAKK